MASFKKILVPIDFGDASARALEVATDWAVGFGAKLALVHVYEIPVFRYSELNYAPIDLLTPVEQAARKQLEDTLALTRKRLPDAEGVLRRGVAWREIVSAIGESGADLVVMGTHGHTGLTHVLLGSVAEKTVRFSPVPVLTLRGDG